jgi:hypothetical protein
MATKKRFSITARQGTVAQIIQRGIAAGHSPERILRDVGKKFPQSKSGKKDVSYYKWLMSGGQRGSATMTRLSRSRR